MKFKKRREFILNESNSMYPPIGDIEGDTKLLGFKPDNNMEKLVNDIIKKHEYVFNYLRDN